MRDGDSLSAIKVRVELGEIGFVGSEGSCGQIPFGRTMLQKTSNRLLHIHDKADLFELIWGN